MIGTADTVEAEPVEADTVAGEPGSGSAEVSFGLESTFTFVAADPPRHSYLCAWNPESPGGLGHDDADCSVELLLPGVRGVAATTVTGRRVPMVEAIDLLTPVGHHGTASPSARGWAAIIRTALSLIADAKVLPWVSPNGWDAWRVDPIEAPDHERLMRLGEQLPAAAYATPGPRRGRIAEPLFTVRAALDAVADAFIRTPAAHRVSDLQLFADPSPTRSPQLRPWVHDLATAHCAAARLVLRMVPPFDPSAIHAESMPASEQDQRTGDWTVRFQLHSRVDPSLIVDAGDFWAAPAEVMERLGAQAETVLLGGLRTVARIVEPLANVLDELAPSTALLGDQDIDQLLDALDELADNHVEVRWPSELLAPSIERRLVISAGSPRSAMAPLLQLDGLLDIDWEFLVDGVAMTASELRALANAKRSVVSLRGRWVRLDRETLDRLRQPPPELSATEALALALGAEVELPDIDETLRVRVAGSFEDILSQVKDLAGSREQDEPKALRATLRPYQRRGLAWMHDLAALGLGGCLADDMGLGKTIQVLALHATRGIQTDTRGPMLVVCPTSLLRNWQRESARFLPDNPVRIFHGANRDLTELDDHEIVVTSYGVVRSDAARLDTVNWDLVVADEAQYAKNPRSRTARALREITTGVRIALTGTPVENKLSELWSIYDWAVPGLLGSLETFQRTTALPIERDGDPGATGRLQALLGPFLLRRHKTDPGIAPDLPDKIERDVFVPLTGEQITLYKAAVDQSLDAVAEAEGIQRRGLVLKLLTSLKQITNHPAQFLGQDGPLPGRSGKLDALVDLLLAIRDEAESESLPVDADPTDPVDQPTTLVFTQYVKMGELIVDHLTNAGHRVALLHGGLTVNARQALVDQVQAGDLDVLVLSLKAAGTGLNLTNATHVVHFDRGWNPAVEDQATDRAYRIGQDRTVTVHRIMTQGTVEDRVAALLEAKRALAASVTSGGESWIGELDDDELADLVTLAPVAVASTGPDDPDRRVA